MKRIILALFLAACSGGQSGDVGMSRDFLGTDSAQYSFESGTQGWVKSGNKITTVTTSTTQVFLGNQSLAVNFVSNGAASGQQVVVANTQQLAGKTITYNVFLPAGMKLSSLQVFAQENASNGWRWDANWRPVSALRLGQWNTLQLSIPGDAAPLQSIGVEFALSAAWSGAVYVDSVGWPTSVQDSGTPDSGVDAGAPDSGTDAGVDAGVDAGLPDSGQDSGTFVSDGGSVTAVRFGAGAGKDGLFSSSPVNPNLRTVAGWVRLRTTTVNQNRQENMWSLENNAPSNVYQLLITTYHTNQWESHDSSQGGFLFAPVDLGWWFIAETNNSSTNTTKLYYRKDGNQTLNVTSGNTHPSISGITRFLIGTDDATGQNEWLDGDLAGVKVWGAELSQAELLLESQHLSPVRTSGLHAFYPLQTVSTMLQDSSGNGRNLTPIVSGGSWSQQTGPSIPYQ